MIVVAMLKELELVPDIMKNHNEILITGIGALNVIRALSRFDKETKIYNIGYAGSNCLPIGTKVQIKKSQLYHPNVEYDEPLYELSADGVLCLTSNDFVLETEIKEPCVFDMELAYIMAMGFTNVIAEKVVSDNLSMKQYDKYVGDE